MRCRFAVSREEGLPVGSAWQCWTVRPQAYVGYHGPMPGCHMLVSGTTTCTACRSFGGDLRCVESLRLSVEACVREGQQSRICQA